MKKICLVALAMVALSFASCGNKAATCSDTCDSTSVDTVVVDTVSVDSIVAE